MTSFKFIIQNIIAGFFLAMIILSSCSKDKAPFPVRPAPVYDTIYPGPYLPIYPGSWWRYLDADGDTIISQVINEWELVDTVISHNNFEYPNQVDTGAHYVVRWAPPTTFRPSKTPSVHLYSTRYFYYYYKYWYLDYGNSLIDWISPGMRVLIPYVSETKGDKWFIDRFSSAHGAYKDAFGETKTTDTTIVINGTTYSNVLKVETFTNSYKMQRRYLAKNIGVIRYEEIGQWTTDTLELIGYHINH